MIRAETHPDDHAMEIHFDAEPWFAQASDEEILGLSHCYATYHVPEWDDADVIWGQDCDSDQVAIETAGSNDDVAKVFEYVELRRQFGDMGFECYVHGNDALNWIKENRPHLVEPIREYWAKEHDLSLLE